MPIVPDQSYLKQLSLVELKKQEMVVKQEVADRQKEIDQTIKIVQKKGLLPRTTAERYDKKFGKKNEKKAFFNVIIVFLFCFILTFFVQPSIFFLNNTSGLSITNYSQREVKNLSVYRLEDFFSQIGGKAAQPVLLAQTLGPKSTLQINSPKTQVFLALADRQLPAIGIILNPASNQQINTSSNNDNGDLVYSKLREQLGTSDQNGG